MKLSECKHGLIVCKKDMEGLVTGVGMIVGITNNRPSSSIFERTGADYAIPLIQWSKQPDLPRGIHPANIYLYED